MVNGIGISDIDVCAPGFTCVRVVGKNRAKHGKARRRCGAVATVAVEWEDGHRWWDSYCDACWKIVGGSHRRACLVAKRNAADLVRGLGLPVSESS